MTLYSAGWRSSEYGYQYQAEPSYFINQALSMASRFPGSVPGGIYVIGEIDGNPGSATATYLSFPKPATGTYPNIRFDTKDKNEKYLTAYDNANLKVWLQVEPADADINTLIEVVLNQYKHHPCVVGFGVDVEWYREAHYPGWGKKTTVAEVSSWNAKVKSINPNYKLSVKHWDESYLANVSGVVYVDDSEENGSLNGMISSFKTFANKFLGNDVGFQIGYPSDKSWWGNMSNPPKQIGDAIIATMPNTSIYGIYWVDFSITDINWVVPTTKYRCTGSPNYECLADSTGPYNTLEECLSACKAPSGGGTTCPTGQTNLSGLLPKCYKTSDIAIVGVGIGLLFMMTSGKK